MTGTLAKWEDLEDFERLHLLEAAAESQAVADAVQQERDRIALLVEDRPAELLVTRAGVRELARRIRSGDYLGGAN